MAVYEALLLNTVVPQIQAAQAGDSYVMVVNATTPALRITQTGTGNALEVEDSANPDATPFVVTAAGDVGIGTSSPGSKLGVSGAISIDASVTSLPSNGGVGRLTSNALTYFTGLNSGGAGTVLNNGNGTATIQLIRNDPSGAYIVFEAGSGAEKMRITATGTLNIVGAGTAGSTQAISFNGSTPVDTLVTTSGGLVGIGTSSPLSKLHINVDGIAQRITRGSALGYLYWNGSTSSSDFTLQAANGNVQLFCELGSSGVIKFATEGAERARITSTGEFQWKPDGTTQAMTLDASGNLLVGTISATAGAVFKVTGATANSISHQVWTTASSTDAAYWTEGSGTVNGVATGSNAAAAMIRVNKDSGTTRSINAAGSLNASGADYAEYMTKAGNFEIAKGDICGIDKNGKLTNVFDDAVSFVVKSTDPSYVGGDTWFVEEAPSDEAELPAFKERMESARQMVDRIAFAGQVPVNVIGATAGQYIVPVNDNGAIKGIAVNSPTFEQYQIALGKVIAIESDGRARIIVKVV